MDLKVQIADDEDHRQNQHDDHIEQPIGLAGRSDEDRQMLDRRGMYRIASRCVPPSRCREPCNGHKRCGSRNAARHCMAQERSSVSSHASPFGLLSQVVT